ncbi:MAG: hypothetical protein WC850_03730 [Candidatus Gracilibacteria bacterium]
MSLDVKLDHPLPGEVVELIIKRHWIVYVFIGVYFFSAVLLSSALIFFFSTQIWVYIILIVFWMGFALFLYVKRLDHELDLFIITNNKVIGIEQVSLLNRTVSECSLSQVQEVGSKTMGFFANMLNYGSITILTAGNATNFTMDFAPDAINTSSKILSIINTYRNSNLKESKTQITEVPENIPTQP